MKRVIENRNELNEEQPALVSLFLIHLAKSFMFFGTFFLNPVEGCLASFPLLVRKVQFL